MASPVNPDNDPLIKDLYEKLPDMTNVDAAKLGLAVQKVIRGENLQETDPEMYAIYMQSMAAADKASADWMNDRRKVIEAGYDEANMPSDKEAVRLRKEANEKFAAYKANARLNTNQKKKFFQDHIKNGPFVELYVEPKVVIGRVGDNQQTQLEGQVVGLAGVRLYLEPGLQKRVPQLFAQRYEQIVRSEKETSARKEIMQGKGIDPTGGPGVEDGWQQMAKKMKEINDDYGSTSGSGEAGDRWDTPDLWQPF